MRASWSGLPSSGVAYDAFCDPSGGLGDSFACAIAHKEDDGACVLDCLHETVAPFDPAAATKEIAATLKLYGVTKVIGDKYAAQWPVSEFSRNDITYEHSERDRTAIYADFLPLLTSGRARLLDAPRLVGQLCNLERRASPMGRDKGSSIRLARMTISPNAAAGASWCWRARVRRLRSTSQPVGRRRPAELFQSSYYFDSNRRSAMWPL